MKVILFADESSKIRERLMSVIKGKTTNGDPWCVKTIDDLSYALRVMWDDAIIAVISVCSQKDLLKLEAIKELFEGVRIILILPDRSSRTVSLGLKLYPSYYSYQDGDLKDVSAVLEKCLTL